MKIVVTGSRGQLGQDMVGVLSKTHEVIGLGRVEMNLEDLGAINGTLAAIAPDVVVHCGAYTKVDLAEDERDRCWSVNVEATRQIAEYVSERRIKMVFISTDYVFDGEKEGPYAEDDPIRPINYYGLTKAQGEKIVRELVPRHIILRISWVFGPHGDNFVSKIMRAGAVNGKVRVVCDQKGSPTYTRDIAGLVARMISSEIVGTYHATNEGHCTWYEYSKEIFRLASMEVQVDPVPASTYPTKAKRPRNSLLCKDKLEKAGFGRLPDWQDALQRYLNEGAIQR